MPTGRDPIQTVYGHCFCLPDSLQKTPVFLERSYDWSRPGLVRAYRSYLLLAKLRGETQTRVCADLRRHVLALYERNSVTKRCVNLQADLRLDEAVANYNYLYHRLGWSRFGLAAVDLPVEEDVVRISENLTVRNYGVPLIPLSTREEMTETEVPGLFIEPALPEETNLSTFGLDDALIAEYEPSARSFHTPQAIRRQLLNLLSWDQAARRPHTHLQEVYLLTAIETTLLFAALDKLTEKEEVITACLHEHPEIDRTTLLDVHHWQRVRSVLEKKKLLKSLAYEQSQTWHTSLLDVAELLTPPLSELLTPRDRQELAKLERIRRILEEN